MQNSAVEASVKNDHHVAIEILMRALSGFTLASHADGVLIPVTAALVGSKLTDPAKGWIPNPPGLALQLMELGRLNLISREHPTLEAVSTTQMRAIAAPTEFKADFQLTVQTASIFDAVWLQGRIEAYLQGAAGLNSSSVLAQAIGEETELSELGVILRLKWLDQKFRTLNRQDHVYSVRSFSLIYTVAAGSTIYPRLTQIVFTQVGDPVSGDSRSEVVTVS